ncbi:FprA family A-type flavoprotein [Bengtsoniella intestinalis]|uniref:FprA family A-type flavoprotein n=1 Tax=Bengtsoniella intestinalis TaxID=3073143 RepID=UPI00391EFD25
MHSVRKITDDLYFLGVDERRLHLFENIHPIARGVSYNSYLLMDEKTVLFDTADWAVCRQYLENIEYVLGDRSLDYLVVNHMEPDHAASLQQVLIAHPEVQVISTEKAFGYMNQFGYDIGERGITVTEGDTMSFGKHTIAFVLAPMVHWPEAMVSFDLTDGTLFAADAFGSFGALNGALFNDEVNFDRDWIDDARRYYTNIVGKYGPHVQLLLGKASGLPIKLICPLHGPVWRSEFGYILDKYNRWSSYTPETKGVLIVYGSMYGNTEAAAVELASQLIQGGLLNVKVFDVSSTHVSELIAYAFQYSHIVLASVTYNLGIYPPMHNFLMDMKALNLQKRTVAIMENGSWACVSGKLMQKELDEMKEMTILNEQMTILSSVNEANAGAIPAMAEALIDSVAATEI